MNSENQIRPVDILLVEDNPGDVRLVQEAFKESRLVNNMMVAEDGETAIAMLRQEGEYKGSARPDLVLLDLNIPLKSGLEVLKEIRSDDRLKSIPVIILTTSKAEQDILRSYNLNCNAYVIKPVRLDQFQEAMEALKDFWLCIVKLPGKEA